MKKVLVFFSCFTLVMLPTFSYAAIDSLNGLTDAIQTFITPGPNADRTMHMDIIPVGTDKHRFRWDGSPWRVDQGGTGAAAFSFGGLLVGNGANPFGVTFSPVLSSITATSTESMSSFAGNVAIGGTSYLNNTVWGTPGGQYGGVSVGDSVLFYTTSGMPLDFSGQDISFSAENEFNVKATNGVLFETDQFDVYSNEAIDLRAGNQDGFHLRSEGGFFFDRNEARTGTTTVTIGEIGNQDSHSCINMKNTDGDDVSFYIVGTSMVIEPNPCR